MNDVIVAISTPLAPAGLGVIRLSGENAPAIADNLFRPLDSNRAPSALSGYTAAYGHLFDKDGDFDDAVALVFRAPHSYTGENVVELSCHGGLYILQRAVRAAIAAGARPAEAGEFTKRAFLNGKMDLTGADAVMDLIGAQGEPAAKTALAAREGATFRALEAVKADLLAVAAQAAAYVDYPYEDIPELEPEALGKTLAAADDALSSLLSTFDAGKILREGVDTVLVGSPNVGKSTLMNRLSGYERSIVTEEAGTTRDVVEETVRLGNVTLRLADTAGIRETDNRAESIGVQRAKDRLHNAALVLAVFDGGAPLSDDDRALAETAAQNPLAIAVLNKSDLGRDSEAFLRAQFREVVVLSAKTGDGMDVLTAAIERVTGLAHLTGDEAILSTERQYAAAAKALEAVRRAADAAQAGLTSDLIGADIDDAIAAITELTGEKVSEAVVDEVFSRFCVGK